MKISINIKKNKMKSIELKSRKFLRKMFNGISLTAVAFIFQACYGPGPDACCDMKLTGTVVSKTTNLPIKGIKVSVSNGVNFGLTDENGKFDFYSSIYDCSVKGNYTVSFLDVDGAANGQFNDKFIYIKFECKDEVKINVELEEKN
jgi:hypothetical protein